MLTETVRWMQTVTGTTTMIEIPTRATFIRTKVSPTLKETVATGVKRKKNRIEARECRTSHGMHGTLTAGLLHETGATVTLRLLEEEEVEEEEKEEEEKEKEVEK
jgi:hypothetical protein